MLQGVVREYIFITLIESNSYFNISIITRVKIFIFIESSYAYHIGNLKTLNYNKIVVLFVNVLM